MGDHGEAATPDWVSELEKEAWAGRPFARTFDLISSQYGWCDEQVLDLTLGRFRQIRDVIFERQAEERRKTLQLEETKVKTLAQFLARSAKAEKAARSISFLEPPNDSGVTGKGRVVKEIPAEIVGMIFDG